MDRGRGGIGLWLRCLTLLSTIFQLFRGRKFYRSAGENHCPAASNSQTLSHNVVLSTSRLSGVRTHNVSCDGPW